MATERQDDYTRIMRAIRARQFAPVYVLMGEEGYFIDQIATALATTVLSPDEQAFNQFVVYGVDLAPGQLYDMAREFPMMAEYKVIIVREAQTLRSTAEVEKYLAHPSPQTILVYCHKNGTIKANSTFIKKAKAVGEVFESKKVSDDKLVAFIEGYVKEKGKTIDHDTALAIAASIGSDLCRLTSELDKVCLATDDKHLSPLLVEQCVGVSRTYNPFEFVNAVAAYDYAKAYTILDYFAKNPKTGGPFVLVPTLFSYFQTLLMAWHAPHREQRGAIAAYLELSWQGQEDRYKAAMHHYPEAKVRQIISFLRTTDEKMKGLGATNTTPVDLATDLLFFLFH